MTQKLDPFYLVVDQAGWIERLVPLGVKLVQLRIKNAEESDIRSQIQRAKQTCAKHECQLVINDYWQIAIDEGCDYIHLGQEDLAEADLDAIRAAELKLGVSTHSVEELDIALAVNPDYVALGPVYPTRLKKMPWAPQGEENIIQWKKLVGDVPLCGIGGLTPERAVGVLQAGADTAAVVTDISLNEDPEARTREWLKVTRPFATE